MRAERGGQDICSFHFPSLKFVIFRHICIYLLSTNLSVACELVHACVQIQFEYLQCWIPHDGLCGPLLNGSSGSSSSASLLGSTHIRPVPVTWGLGSSQGSCEGRKARSQLLGALACLQLNRVLAARCGAVWCSMVQ